MESKGKEDPEVCSTLEINYAWAAFEFYLYFQLVRPAQTSRFMILYSGLDMVESSDYSRINVSGKERGGALLRIPCSFPLLYEKEAAAPASRPSGNHT